MLINKKYSKEQYSFIKSISYLLKGKIGIIDALDIVSLNYKKSFQTKIYKVKKSLEKGETVYKSFSYLIKDDDVLEMIKIAEETGKLEEVFQNIYSKYEFKRYIKKEIMKLSFYPIIVIFTAIVVILILFNTVVPKFKKMYDDIGASLPSITRNVILISDFFNRFFYVIIITLFLIIFLFKKYVSSHKMEFEKYMIQNKLFGKIIRDIKLLNLTQNIHSLLKSNIDIADAIFICINGETSYIKQQLQIIRYNILKGKTVTYSFSNSHLFDDEYKNFIRIGDNTGNLTESFNILHNIYNERVKERIEFTLKIMEPLLIIFIGIILSIIIFAIMLPMLIIGESINI